MQQGMQKPQKRGTTCKSREEWRRTSTIHDHQVHVLPCLQNIGQGSLAAIIAWLFKCLKEWTRGIPEQYVLMGVVFPPLIAALQVSQITNHPRDRLSHTEFHFDFPSLLILISLCPNCIFPKMFSKVFLFWFNRLSFQCLGWNWGGALWKVNAFEWWSFLWTEIQYCSTKSQLLLFYF